MTEATTKPERIFPSSSTTTKITIKQPVSELFFPQMKTARFKAGEVLFKEGDRSLEAYRILKGKGIVTLSPTFAKIFSLPLTNIFSTIISWFPVVGPEIKILSPIVTS